MTLESDADPERGLVEPIADMLCVIGRMNDAGLLDVGGTWLPEELVEIEALLVAASARLAELEVGCAIEAASASA